MISVVLVTYNSMNVLLACMEALERCSSAPELEVIVVDNASTDGTHDWVSAYQSRGDRTSFRDLKVLFIGDNWGYAHANNRGIEMSHGDIVLLLNPDTIVSVQAIERCADILTGDSRVGAVGCRLVLPDGRLDRACRRAFPTLWNSFTRLSGLSLVFPKSRLFAGYNLSYMDDQGIYPVDCLCGAFMMVRREALTRVGLLNERFFMYGEDIDWCYRIKRAGYGIVFNGSVDTIHVKGGNGGKKSKTSIRHFYDTMYTYYTETLGHAPQRFSSRMVLCGVRILYWSRIFLRSLSTRKV